METLTNEHSPRLDGAWRGLAWFAGLLATAAALAVGAVFAVFVAASLVVVVLMGAVLAGFAGLAFRARRRARTTDPTVIDARHLGGHSWVAYGWDEQPGR